DDAIVVVENVERNIATGLSPRDAARRSMDEVGGALIAIALVLTAVFVPSAFITGISGQFYPQFPLTIAGATPISLLLSLTASPPGRRTSGARPRHPPPDRPPPPWGPRPLPLFSPPFNGFCGGAAAGSGWPPRHIVRIAAIMLIAYAGILAYGLNEFRKTPSG